MPSNFRTYEAQSRLLAAVIASTPTLKLNFKAIALHYGSDVTAWGIEHRFRPIKKQAAAVRQAVVEGKDAKDMASIFHLSDKDIAKYYGESTPQGIEFQFRSIRKDAKAIRDAVDKGASPLTARKNVPAASAIMAGGSGAGAGASTAAARKRKTPAGESDGAGVGGSGSSSATRGPKKTPAKRVRAEAVFSNEEESLASDDVDYDQLDLTPVSTPTKRTPTSAPSASRLGANVVNASTPAGASVSAAPPITPSTTFVPDATPALSIGATPPDDASLETADLFHGGQHGSQQLAPQNQKQQQQQQIFHQQATHMNQMFYGVDNDDDVFIIDTPSKMPKMEAAAVATTAAAGTAPPPHNLLAPVSDGSDFGSWDNLGQPHHHSAHNSQSQHHFSFDTGSSWPRPDFFQPADHISSFSQSQSFYDNDGSI